MSAARVVSTTGDELSLPNRPTPLERAFLASQFLARWVDVAEPANERLTKRVEKALAMADLLWEAAHR